ncbi:MAG: hypothetical protein ACRDJP_00995 [Actinomycetota bacterium]
MHIEVGPFPSASAQAWLKYARGVLDEVRAGSGTLPPDIVTAFEAYLDEWDRAAATRPTFRWSGDADPEVVEYLLHAWFNLASSLARRAEERGVRTAPPEGEVFYNGLVQALLDALAEEGRAGSAFAEQLRTDWPGLGRDP